MMSSYARVAAFEIAVAFARHAMLFVSRSLIWLDHTTPLNDIQHNGYLLCSLRNNTHTHPHTPMH
jgi:hypothetical protein